MQPWMKSRQWLITVGLLAMVLIALVGLFVTRDLGPLASSPGSKTANQQIQLVDESPLKTARTLAKLASGEDEHRFADAAAQLADNEVDLAFHDALRDAANHPLQPKSQDYEFFAHENEAEAQLKADQDRIDQLKKQINAASGAHQDSLQQQLDVIQAQLELDQDELGDAKEDLIRSGADPGSLIQRQFDEHQAAEHASDEKPAAAAANNAEISYRGGSLYQQFAAWRALREKAIPLQQAQDEARGAAAALVSKHAVLDEQVKAAKAKPRDNPPAGSQSNAGPSENQHTSAPSTALSLIHI